MAIKKISRELIFFILGIALIILGAILMADFFFKFFKFVIGLILLVIGLQFVFGRRWR